MTFITNGIFDSFYQFTVKTGSLLIEFYGYLEIGKLFWFRPILRLKYELIQLGL